MAYLFRLSASSKKQNDKLKNVSSQDCRHEDLAPQIKEMYLNTPLVKKKRRNLNERCVMLSHLFSFCVDLFTSLKSFAPPAAGELEYCTSTKLSFPRLFLIYRLFGCVLKKNFSKSAQVSFSHGQSLDKHSLCLRSFLSRFMKLAPKAGDSVTQKNYELQSWKLCAMIYRQKSLVGIRRWVLASMKGKCARTSPSPKTP